MIPFPFYVWRYANWKSIADWDFLTLQSSGSYDGLISLHKQINNKIPGHISPNQVEINFFKACGILGVLHDCQRLWEKLTVQLDSSFSPQFNPRDGDIYIINSSSQKIHLLLKLEFSCEEKCSISLFRLHLVINNLSESKHELPVRFKAATEHLAPGHIPRLTEYIFSLVMHNYFTPIHSLTPSSHLIAHLLLQLPESVPTQFGRDPLERRALSESVCQTSFKLRNNPTLLIHKMLNDAQIWSKQQKLCLILIATS